jgi:hypothetical protein
LSFYAQHGYGKSNKLDVLADGGNLGGVILSPADEAIDALRATARAMARKNVETLLDPQTYIYTIPNAVGRCHADIGLNFGPIHWGSITPADIQAQVDAVVAANDEVVTTGPVIAPAPRQGTFGDLWLPVALQYARTTKERAGGRAVLASVVVEEAALTDWAGIERWLDVVTTLELEGFYLVVGRRTAYPAAWDRAALCSLLRIVYRLRILNEYRVVVGYADTAGLAAIAMGADAIASGWNYRQRHFLSDRWVPRDGGQAPVPRVTSAALLSALLGIGEMDGAARSPIGPLVLPDDALRERIARRPESWANPDAVVQHLTVLGELVAALEAAGDVPARLDFLAAATTEARRLLVELARNGARVDPVHTTAVLNLAAAAADARAAEGV